MPFFFGCFVFCFVFGCFVFCYVFVVCVLFCFVFYDLFCVLCLCHVLVVCVFVLLWLFCVFVYYLFFLFLCCLFVFVYFVLVMVCFVVFVLLCVCFALCFLFMFFAFFCFLNPDPPQVEIVRSVQFLRKDNTSNWSVYPKATHCECSFFNHLREHCLNMVCLWSWTCRIVTSQGGPYLYAENKKQ